MSQNDKVAKLRKKLTGVKWADFTGGKIVQIGNVVFHAKVGFFLGQCRVAVLAEDKIIAIITLPEDIGLRNINNHDILNPKDHFTGYHPLESIKVLTRHKIIFVLPEENTQVKHDDNSQLTNIPG